MYCDVCVREPASLRACVRVDRSGEGSRPRDSRHYSILQHCGVRGSPYVGMVGLGQTGEKIGRRTVGRDGRSWTLSTHLLDISHFYIIRYFVLGLLYAHLIGCIY